MVVKENIDMGDTQKFLNPEQQQAMTMEIGDGESPPRKIEFNGLSKEEIMKFGNDPKWVRIRWALFIAFWVIWFSMLTAAILVVVFAPKCAPRPKQVWYEREAAYELDVAYFKSSGNDGHGDIKGLRQIVEDEEYFKRLNFDTLILQSSLINETDPKNVNAKFGGLDDMKALKKSLESKNMHLILEFPQKYLKENGSSIISFWLTNYADGLRISEVEDNNKTVESFLEWTSTVRTIESKTFQAKLLTFYPSTEKLKKAGAKAAFYDDLLAIDKIKLGETENFYDIVKKINDGEPTSSFYFTLGREGKKRVATRLDGLEKKRYLFDGLALLLRGNPVSLYGDEIGFVEQDANMSWDDVKLGLAHGSGETLINMYESLLNLKREPSLTWGDVYLGADTKQATVYARVAKRFDGYIVAANTRNQNELLDFSVLFKKDKNLPFDVPSQSTVEYFFSADEAKNDDFTVGAKVYNHQINLKPGEFLVLKFQNDQV